MLINLAWVLTTSLLNCFPKFMLKVVKNDIMGYIGNESLFINVCTCFCISERIMAKHNSSNKGKCHKPKRSEELAQQREIQPPAPGRGRQVNAGGQVFSFCEHRE